MVHVTNDGVSAAALESFGHVDLLAAIACELTTQPINEATLHQHVWNYVADERTRGTPPGRVIITLTEMVAEEAIASPAQRQALQRSVIHAAVAGYFGQNDGTTFGPAGPDLSGVSRADPMMTPLTLSR